LAKPSAPCSESQIGAPVFRGLALFGVVAEHHGARLGWEDAEGGLQVTLRSAADLTAEAVAAVTGAGANILRLESVEPSLEDAVLALAEPGTRPGEAGTDAAD